MGNCAAQKPHEKGIAMAAGESPAISAGRCASGTIPFEQSTQGVGAEAGTGN
jgi:hypothetical protein